MEELLRRNIELMEKVLIELQNLQQLEFNRQSSRRQSARREIPAVIPVHIPGFQGGGGGGYVRESDGQDIMPRGDRLAELFANSPPPKEWFDEPLDDIFGDKPAERIGGVS